MTTDRYTIYIYVYIYEQSQPDIVKEIEMDHSRECLDVTNHNYSEQMVALVAALSVGAPHRPGLKWQNEEEAQHEPRAH